MPPMPLDIAGFQAHVTAALLTPEAFAPFGDVVQNPRPDVHPSRHAAVTLGGGGLATPAAELANQGTAIKYRDVSRVRDLYARAPSGVPGAAAMNMFVCGTRELAQPGSTSGSSDGEREGGGEDVEEEEAAAGGGSAGTFVVSILERHPFTTQTFIPLTADPRARYLVIVAPSLPPSPADAHLPAPSVPWSSSSLSSSPAAPDAATVQQQHQPLPGRGLPDLGRLRAFVATAAQAVTYGAGTWHAPMAALGEPGIALDFVVVQFANGVAVEDCQEVELSSSSSSSWAVTVRVPERARVSKL